jgi:hypothetical protein
MFIKSCFYSGFAMEPITDPLGRFANYVKACAAETAELPVVHSTRCERFSGIAATQSLSPTLCEVFNEPLLYLFYGRPSYASKMGTRPSTELAYCPVCFVIKADAVETGLARLYPFDSGAAHRGMFDPFIPAGMLPTFALDPTIESARRIASAFFETNGNYYLGRARPDMVIPEAEVEAASYYQLITTPGEAAYDERRSSIEIQTRAELTLKNNLLAVILPDQFLDDPVIRRVVVKEWRAHPLTYLTFHGGVPMHYVRDIYSKLHTFLGEGGYL